VQVPALHTPREIQAVGSPKAAAALLTETFCIKAFLGLILGAFFATCDLRLRCPHCCRLSGVGTARTACDTIRQATVTWKTVHPADGCPTVEQLRMDKALDRDFFMKDAWGNPFKLTCATDETVCTTAGPDKREGTEDDIIRPPPEPMTQAPAR
jgi:hypothetical protein